MLTIQPSQMAALEAAVEEKFLAGLVDFIREEYADDVDDLSPEQLRKWIVAGVARAERHGFTAPAAIAQFLVLMFEIAPNFDEHPAFAEALADTELDEEERIAAARLLPADEDWDAARDAYDEAAWGL